MIGFLLALTGVGHALDPEASAPEQVEGDIVSVNIEGLVRIEEAALRTVIQLRTGESMGPWKVARDIKAIYGTGFVEDVRVTAEMVDGGVAITFVVVEKPAIREVRITGNKKIDEDNIREVVDIGAFEVLNEADVNDNARRIRDKYVEKGYYLVEVDPVVREVGDDLVELTFDITENRKVIVQSIDITGNQNVPDRKIRRFMQTKQGGIAPWLTSSGNFDETILETDGQIVRSVFLEEGFVDVKVDTPKVYLSPDKRFIYITIQVEEGPQYQLGEIQVDGDFVPEEGLTEGAVRQIIAGDVAKTVGERWKRAKATAPEGTIPQGWDRAGRDGFLVFNEKHPALESGDTFKLSSLQVTMGQVSDLYGDQGYAFVNVVPETATDPERKVVDITLAIQRGDKVRIGHIDITGNDPTFDKVVRREIPINEGEIYAGRAIREGRERLERLGFFEEVSISTPKGSAPDVLDMKVEVTEQPTGSFSVGAGFSNLENFVFTTNVSKNNFMGLGYVMSAAVNLSSARQQFDFSMFDPYFLDSRWTFNLRGFSISRQFVENEYQRGGTIAIGRYLDRRDDVRLVFDYTAEDTGLISIDAYKERLLGGQLYRNGLTSTAGLSLNVDKRNNRINATRGIFSSASVDLSGGFRTDEDTVTSVLGGDFNMVEAKFNFRAYQPVVPGEWLIFKYNGTIGKVASTDGSVVPWIHRYRAGGINSVRGYNWYSLGPSIRALGFTQSGGNSTSFIGMEDPTAADNRLVVGGSETWINNFELEMPIVRAAGISTVLFFDAGNAFGDPWGNGHIDPLGLRTAYGAGIRWFSPMGPLRFEYGFPTKPYEDERRAVFDFSIGSLF